MIAKVKTLRNKVILNLLNVDFKANEEDIRDLYSNVQIVRIEPQQRGIFLLEVENSEEALKILSSEDKSIGDRKITVRLGMPKRHDNYEKEGNYNKERRPPAGGYEQRGDRKKYSDNKKNFNHNNKDQKSSYNRKGRIFSSLNSFFKNNNINKIFKSPLSIEKKDTIKNLTKNHNLKKKKLKLWRKNQKKVQENLLVLLEVIINILKILTLFFFDFVFSCV